jgi:membrane-bound lytic murein transglycosylase D
VRRVDNPEQVAVERTVAERKWKPERTTRQPLWWLLAAGILTLGARGAAHASGPFEVPPTLAHQVHFWRDVFATYSKYQVVLHDTERLDRIYSVLDFRDLAQRGYSEGAIEQAQAEATKREKQRLRALLRRLHQSGGRDQGLTAEERRIRDLFRGSADPKQFLRAAAEDRVRAQAGIRERFAAGIEVGHRYFREMERIFDEEGVPRALTRLPLIESCFNVRAYSKAGAAGIWQFVPATGRRFMRIDDAVDERRDPLLSTRAAARFLRENYERLGTWPLAITAYNHGPAGVARAVERTGSRDIVTIIQSYQGPAFKFASRNFYPEFLAALELERDHARYFGPLRLQQPVPTDTVRLAHFLDLRTVARLAGVDPEVVAELNPGLSRAVYDGELYVPEGQLIRLPAGTRDRFQQHYAALPPQHKFNRQRVTYVVHRVQHGQTLGAIARRYGRSVEEIRRYNNLRSVRYIRVGQMLRIPRT